MILHSSAPDAIWQDHGRLMGSFRRTMGDSGKEGRYAKGLPILRLSWQQALIVLP